MKHPSHCANPMCVTGTDRVSHIETGMGHQSARTAKLPPSHRRNRASNPLGDAILLALVADVNRVSTEALFQIPHSYPHQINAAIFMRFIFRSRSGKSEFGGKEIPL